MKKTILLITCLAVSMLFAGTSELVARAEPGFKVGYQTRDGFKAGAFYTIHLGSGFALQPEIFLSQRQYKYSNYPCYYGSEIIHYIPGFDEHGYDTVRYVEIPVLLKYTVNLKSNFKPVLFAGGFTAFRVTPEKLGDNYYGYTYRKYKDVDAGLIFGLGFEHKLGKIKMHYDFRYTLGLVDVQEAWSSCMEVWDPSHGDWWSPQKRKNRSFAFMVGVSF